MEMQEAAPVAAWWNELPEDFQTDILDWMSLEAVYRYAIVCKEWKELLSSNDFRTWWAEAPINRKKQQRLVLCDRNPAMPYTAFCFYTGTWITYFFKLSFLEDWALLGREDVHPYRGIILRHSVARLLLVSSSHNDIPLFRLCNPYTRKFVDIALPDLDIAVGCVVVNEIDNRLSHDAFKVVAIGEPSPQELETLEVLIYEPSQRRWKVVGFIGEDISIPIDAEHLVFWNGSFYGDWESTLFDDSWGMLRFTIPLEDGNSSATTPIPVILIPYPNIVQSLYISRHLVYSPRLITCRSRLLLMVALNILDEDEAIVIMWEFKIQEDRFVSWNWVEITRMPPLLCMEWINKFGFESFMVLGSSCVGVGDHVCFVPSLRSVSSPMIEVLAYNLLDNTWNWLPGCPISHRCVGQGDVCDGAIYTGTAFEPSPQRKVE